MKLFQRTPKVPFDERVDSAAIELKKAIGRRRAALNKLVSALRDIPIEEGLARLGDDLTSTDRKAR
jgi:hypothetical protein